MRNPTQSTAFYQCHYYLREGDYLPERFGVSRYRNDRIMLNIFIKSGSIFPTKEEATAASNAILAFLSAYQKQVLSTHRISQLLLNLLRKTIESIVININAILPALKHIIDKPLPVSRVQRLRVLPQE